MGAVAGAIVARPRTWQLAFGLPPFLSIRVGKIWEHTGLRVEENGTETEFAARASSECEPTVFWTAWLRF